MKSYFERQRKRERESKSQEKRRDDEYCIGSVGDTLLFSLTDFYSHRFVA